MLSIVALGIAAHLAKPLAIMVHGAGGGGWEYKFWKPVFEEAGYRVVAPDLQPVAGGLASTKLSDYVDQIVRAAGATPDVLVGASMGGVLVLKAAERLKPKTLVLVCSTLPAGVPSGSAKKAKYPAVVRWAGGPYKDTVDSMPDSDEPTRRFSHPRWRDESGEVLNEIAQGVTVAKPRCRVLSVIPEGDDTISPRDQISLARWAGADILAYNGMSHVGPLLSTRSSEVAQQVVEWLKHRLAK